MKSQPILRLDKTPATQRPPSSDCVDLIFDAESGALKAIDSAGDVPFAGASVTPAGLVTAAGQMTDAQKASFRGAIAAVGYSPDSTVCVNPDGTDADRGTALAAAYTAAKALTPNGQALSVSNRAAVIIPPGAYKVPSTLICDTSFVDLVAMLPAPGGARLATDQDEQGGETPISNFRPSGTLIYSDENTSPFTIIKQTCADMRMVGFSVAYIGTAGGFDVGSFRCLHIDRDQADANSASVYDRMYFFHRTAADDLLGVNQDQGREPVWATKHLQGTWIDCVANAYAWRMGQNGVFTANMTNCQAGAMSWGGDANGASFGKCRMDRCRGIGLLVGTNGQGPGCFGGCTGDGIPIGAEAEFIDCIAEGDFSFSAGDTVAGTFIRCRGGYASFGGCETSVAPAIFSGYAEDCVGGNAAFGGEVLTGVGNGKLTGTLVRCTITGNTESRRLEGATIRDSRITTTVTGKHCVTLLDSNSKITNSDLIVFQGGTGVPIYAASARNVVACHLRMNNASTDADGLHANVTNLIATPYNVIDNDIA